LIQALPNEVALIFALDVSASTAGLNRSGFFAYGIPKNLFTAVAVGFVMDDLVPVKMPLCACAVGDDCASAREDRVAMTTAVARLAHFMAGRFILNALDLRMKTQSR